MMAGGWLAAGALLDQQPRLGRGKVTREAADWYGSRELLKTHLATSRGCEPLAKPVDIGTLRGAGKRFEPRDCQSRPASRLFVIGDSHAMAYLPLLEQLSAEEGRVVTVLPTPGCSYLDLRDALDPERDPQCHRVATDALGVVLAQSRPGDTVFLPSLRVARLVELGGARRRGEDVFSWTQSERDALARAEADAPHWIAPLVGAGLRVILEAPKPVFPAHAFACVETWNRWNPDCAPGLQVPRAELERYRAPVLAVLERLAAHQPGTVLWDPLPTLCPEPVCSALRGGRPLFFDGDHLSPYGNMILLGSFRQALKGNNP